jgi:hypothetical protein
MPSCKRTYQERVGCRLGQGRFGEEWVPVTTASYATRNTRLERRKAHDGVDASRVR